MKEELKNSLKDLTNPFSDCFYYWIKGELYDLKAMQEAFDERNDLAEARLKLINKTHADKSQLEKLNQGKKTLKTFFKSATGKQTEITNLTNSISW